MSHTRPAPCCDLALYGAVRNRPRWLVRLRGALWLHFNCCPCCNSSPPREDCPVCRGDYDYSYRLDPSTREAWRARWARRCKGWAQRGPGGRGVQ